MLEKVVLLVVVMNFLQPSSSKTISELKREILNQILPKNENEILVGPGNLTSDCTEVENGIEVMAINDINEAKGQISFKLTLHQYWQDQRLRYISNNQFDFVTINNDDAIWTPDIFIVNEVKGQFFDGLHSNVYIHIYPNGKVKFSKTISVTLNCPMYFTKYPFDTQKCEIVLESYGYTAKNILLKWKKQKLVPIDFKTTMFKFKQVSSSTGMKFLTTGNYSCLNFDIYYSRNLNYCVYHIYVPCILAVILSWLPFLIDKKMVSSKLVINMGAILFYIVVLCKFSEDQPQAQYSTTIHCFTTTCALFLIFSTMLTVSVHFFDRNKENSVNLVENGSLKETGINVIGLKKLMKKLWRASYFDLGARVAIPVLFALYCVIHFTRGVVYNSD